jgi:hypothetical protein
MAIFLILGRRLSPSWQGKADVDLAIVRKVLTGGALTLVVVLLWSATVPAQGTPNTNSPKTAVLHATVTITGGLALTGSYDDRLPVSTCADVAKGGTGVSGENLISLPRPRIQSSPCHNFDQSRRNS